MHTSRRSYGASSTGLVLVAALIGCAPRGAPPEAPAEGAQPVVSAEPAPRADPASTPGADVEPRLVDEKVTVKNPTAHEIHVELSSSAPGQEDQSSSFGPIPPGGEGSGAIEVWTNGTFTVVARWEADGETVRSRPYTAVLSPDKPVTPVTATLNNPYDTLGVWSEVVWDMPDASR